MKARVLLGALLVASAAAYAQKQTVCTITVNSPDEREVFREHLPADRFDFVELVERGRPDWLGAACRKATRCDVLLVSGHFAGTEFYSSRLHVNETLPVDEMERVACSESCPGLFAELKEVYLFGCDTLNPTPVRTATPEVARSLEREGRTPEDSARGARELAERHGESALDHMRRLFPNVPVIYGFSSKAPYGRVAGPMLKRLFQAGGGDEFGSGRVSERLHRLFAPASMTVATGLRDSDAHADYRAEVCRYFDDRLSPARKLGEIRATMVRSMAETRLTLDRIEKFFAGLGSAERSVALFAGELDAFTADRETRARFLQLTRDTDDPAVRVRLISLARMLGWLPQDEHRAELMRMVGDLLSASATGFGEVDLICTLNKDRDLDQERHRLRGVSVVKGRAADAAMACLGDAPSHARVLRALVSRDERDVQIVQAYLRHRPIADESELRSVAFGVARMDGSGAQVRALETLARQRIADREVLEELTRAFARATSLGVQRAIAEIFLRASYQGTGDLASQLRRYRLRSSDGADLIDTLIERLERS
ncbi:MAG: hypothetical protein ABIQ84_05280 [Usitatibacter sp.]